MKEVKLTQGYVALVDDEDFERVNAFAWHIRPLSGGIYAYHTCYESGPPRRYPSIAMHRFILGITDPKIEVDHWNRDGSRGGLNNQRHNLRVATRKQNIANAVRRRNGKHSRFKGVTWHKRDKLWVAQIGQKHRQIIRTADEVEAAKAYDAEAIKRFGAFARLNFPTGEQASALTCTQEGV